VVHFSGVIILAGIDDSTPAHRVKASREILIEFLRGFASVVQTIEADETKPILGTDSRSGELVRKYLLQKRNHLRASGLYKIQLEDLLPLLASNDVKDLHILVDCLRDLRELVEQHSQTDMNNWQYPNLVEPTILSFAAVQMRWD
jgi:hypothetical protein